MAIMLMAVSARAEVEQHLDRGIYEANIEQAIASAPEGTPVPTFEELDEYYIWKGRPESNNVEDHRNTTFAYWIHAMYGYWP